MLIIIQNDPEVPPGNFLDTIRELDVQCRTIHPYTGEELPPLEEVAAAIVLGGAMGVHDADRHPFLVQLKRFIRACVERQVPFLGVCLGAQMLVKQLGGAVCAQ